MPEGPLAEERRLSRLSNRSLTEITYLKNGALGKVCLIHSWDENFGLNQRDPQAVSKGAV